MLALITKASKDFWYQFKEINTISDLLNIYSSVVVSKNEYADWSKDMFLELWDGIQEKDIPYFKKAGCHVIIYDSWLE